METVDQQRYVVRITHSLSPERVTRVAEVVADELAVPVDRIVTLLHDRVGPVTKAVLAEKAEIIASAFAAAGVPIEVVEATADSPVGSDSPPSTTHEAAGDAESDDVHQQHAYDDPTDEQFDSYIERDEDQAASNNSEPAHDPQSDPQSGPKGEPYGPGGEADDRPRRARLEEPERLGTQWGSARSWGFDQEDANSWDKVPETLLSGSWLAPKLSTTELDEAAAGAHGTGDAGAANDAAQDHTYDAASYDDIHDGATYDGIHDAATYNDTHDAADAYTADQALGYSDDDTEYIEVVTEEIADGAAAEEASSDLGPDPAPKSDAEGVSEWLSHGDSAEVAEESTPVSYDFGFAPATDQAPLAAEPDADEPYDPEEEADRLGPVTQRRGAAGAARFGDAAEYPATTAQFDGQPVMPDDNTWLRGAQAEPAAAGPASTRDGPTRDRPTRDLEYLRDGYRPPEDAPAPEPTGRRRLVMLASLAVLGAVLLILRLTGN